MVRHLIDRIRGTVPKGVKRSNEWPKVRKLFLSHNPSCAVCGGQVKLEVHHKRPFHLHPDLELDPRNLITLCESKKNGANCHLAIGHLGNFKSYNGLIERDALYLQKRLKNRP